MADDKIPPDVKRLIHDKINSVEQLEVLLLVRANSDKVWNAVETSRELRIQPESAATRLTDLWVGGLLERISDSDGSDPPSATEMSFRYKPSDTALAHAADGLAHAYKERRFTVIDLIFSKPTDTIRSFSDAFRLRRGTD